MQENWVNLSAANAESFLHHWGLLHYSTQLGSGWAWAGAFTFVIWTRLKSEVLSHHRLKWVFCLLYISRPQFCVPDSRMTCSRMQTKFSRTPESSQAWLACIPGWPSVNALSCTQPGISLEIFACVNGPVVDAICVFICSLYHEDEFYQAVMELTLFSSVLNC